MTIPVEQIVHEWRRRRRERGPLIEAMRRIAAHYNGDIAIPLPELDAQELPSIANFIGIGIDQTATRMASVMPDIVAPPRKLGVKASIDLAATRRRAALGWWENNRYDLALRQRFRWHIGYSSSPVVILPDSKLQGPKWSLRSPLDAYPSDLQPTEMEPDDCIFGYTRTVGWLRSNFPHLDLSAIVRPGSMLKRPEPLQDSDHLDLVEYFDRIERVQLAVGVGRCEQTWVQAEYGLGNAQIINLGTDASGTEHWAVELLRIPNRTGLCPVVTPGRITLDRPKGQFDDLVGIYQTMAKLNAMEMQAVAEAIWPDTWIVGRPNEQANIVQMADGRQGVVGKIEGAGLQQLQIQPGVQTTTAIDRLERAQRITAGIPAEFGGEAQSNVRTGRRGDQVLGGAIDYTIQEAQEIMARSLQSELQRALETDVAYFNKRKSFFVSWKGGGRLDYVPGVVFGDDRTLIVSYAKTGVDATELNVQIGQMLGQQMISTMSAMRMHPMVKDPEWEFDQITYEGLQRGLVAQMPQLLQSGAVPIEAYVRVMELVRQDKMTPEEAWRKAQQEAQQAQQAQAEAQAAQQPGGPEAQPGMNQPGANQPTAIAAQTPNSKNLTDMLRALRLQNEAAATL